MKRIVLTLLAALVIGVAPASAQIYNHTKTGGTSITAAAALANNTATPTSEKIGSFMMCYDGSTWDMCPGNSANGLQVYSLATATDLAKDEDAGHTSGDRGVMSLGVQQTVLSALASTTLDYAPFQLSSLGAMWTEPAMRAVAYGSSPTAITAGVYGKPIADLEGRPYMNIGHPRAITCQLLTTATTSTQITGCEVVASNSIYVTGVVVSGDIANATATPWILQSGTSTACTGPHILVEGWHPALTTNSMNFNPPLKVTVAEGLCILDGVTGSKAITVSGYIAP